MRVEVSVLQTAPSSGALEIPAITVTAPAHLSQRARMMLTPQGPATPPVYPNLDDKASWHSLINRLNDLMSSMANLSGEIRVQSSSRRLINSVPVFDIEPTKQLGNSTNGIVLDIHGGALILGVGDIAQKMSARFAMQIGRRVCSVDYRMPPDHPYPAGLDDCMTVYRALLHDYDANEILVSGASAGGNLAAALILRLRDEGLPLPAGLILKTPEVDLTESGDSFQTNAHLDSTLRSLMQVNQLYAAGHDLHHPYLSPLFADFSQGFVPTLLTSGTRDLFLSNAVRMHRALRKADIPAELHILDAASHTGFSGAPESEEIDLEIRKFIAACLKEPA